MVLDMYCCYHGNQQYGGNTELNERELILKNKLSQGQIELVNSLYKPGDHTHFRHSSLKQDIGSKHTTHGDN